jgi:hypothetical protein
VNGPTGTGAPAWDGTAVTSLVFSLANGWGNGWVLADITSGPGVNGNYAGNDFSACGAQDNARAGWRLSGGRFTLGGCSADSNSNCGCTSGTTPLASFPGFEFPNGNSSTGVVTGYSFDRGANTNHQQAGMYLGSSLGSLDIHLVIDGKLNNGTTKMPALLSGSSTTPLGGVNAFIGGHSLFSPFDVMAWGAQGDGSTDDTTAINAAISAAISAGGGKVYIPAGTYKFTNLTCTTSSSTVAIPVYIEGDGMEATVLNCYATSGSALDYYGSSTTASVDGGGVSRLTIDGTHASAGVAGLKMHDLFQLNVQEVFVRNFSGTGSKGAWFCNTFTWTEALHGRIYLSNNTANCVFDVASSGTTATSSFARLDLDIFITQGTASFDGVVLQNGAVLYDGRFSIRGNFTSSASALTSAVLRLTGSVPTGHPGAGTVFSSITFGRVEIGVEVDNAQTNKPITIVSNAGGNLFQNCYGIMDFSNGGGAFTAAAGNSFIYPFNGVIKGDATLQGISGTTQIAAYNMPGGVAIGNFSSPATIAASGTISTAATSFAKVTSTGAVGGVILQAGTYSGQVCVVVNSGSNTITFAISGTSHVADGTSDAISGGTGRMFVWDENNSLWYHMT